MPDHDKFGIHNRNRYLKYFGRQKLGDFQKDENEELEEFRRMLDRIHGRDARSRGLNVLAAGLGIIVGVVALLIGAGIMALGWNLALAAIIGVSKINVLQAFVIIFYVTLFTGLWRKLWDWLLKD